MNKTEAIQQAKIIKALIGIAEVRIILNTFIKTFRTQGILKDDGRKYLHGNFNIAGPVSGRMSSNSPNMQNIPSTTKTGYAKPVKECFQAPPGWLMMGADFFSLEDKISALTTRDPNKLKVYTDGYDGHSLRAYSYFKEQMPDIDYTVKSINSISWKYPELRQDSKGPTFALTYDGTSYALINQCGLSPEDAVRIEINYHELYQVSDAWKKAKIKQASKDGYITVAFGLRLRTPILHQILLNKQSTPYAGQSEARTAGNALGQSYGLLNNRAGIEMQKRVFASKYIYDILPIAQIHDASYFLVKDNLACVTWFNKNLIECMQWQELPEIQHDIVKLGGATEIFYPSWANGIAIPNNASGQDIMDIVDEYKKNKKM